MRRIAPFRAEDSEGTGQVPERALLVAMLIRAAREANHTIAGLGSNMGRAARIAIQQDAQNWLRSDEYGSFTFVFVCEELGLNPELTRRALLDRRERDEAADALGGDNWEEAA